MVDQKTNKTPNRRVLSSLALMAIGTVVGMGCTNDEPALPQNVPATPDASTDVSLPEASTPEATPGAETSIDAGPGGVPLAKDSPWPKFRGNAWQNGRASMKAKATDEPAWKYQTGKGIFSSPIVAADGTVFVGSADYWFYALDKTGALKWKYQTGQIIDSAGLLDDKGRVYMASGDGYVYAFDAKTGTLIWKFQADPLDATKAYIGWFEGNVAIGIDGSLYVPNDNFLYYALDRDTGAKRWSYKLADMSWSLAAVNPVSGNLYFGNNSMVPALGDNTFALKSDGTKLWSKSATGTIAASPLLTKDGKVIVGGYDGYVRAYEEKTGKSLWTFGARDHIYSSPAEMEDGTIIQPAADGTIYALNATDGSVKWAFDTLVAIRSSPAIDSEGRIYVGSGDGRLLVLNPDGTLRWAIKLIDTDRDDLNGSPALSETSIVIAGEDGGIFSVPYDYCLRSNDARCSFGPDEDIPKDGVFLWYTTNFGAALATPPTEIDANQPLAFYVYVRNAGDTTLALLDSENLQATIEPNIPLRADVSGDRHFLVVLPKEGNFQPGTDGKINLRMQGQYLVDPAREGLKFSGGKKGGTFDQRYTFGVRPAQSSQYAVRVPQGSSNAGTVWEMYRWAVPLPTIMPSYNQIGFDSQHWLGTVIDGSPTDFTLLVAAAKLVGQNNETVPDPTTQTVFPLQGHLENGLLTFVNTGTVSMLWQGFMAGFREFRLAASLDQAGNGIRPPTFYQNTKCGDLQMYGPFLQLLGFCNDQTDLMSMFGATLMRVYDDTGTKTIPTGIGTVDLAASSTEITATITGSSLKLDEHLFIILLMDPSKEKPIYLPYGPDTKRTAGADGVVQTVSLPIKDRPEIPAQVRAYLVVDNYPAIKKTLVVPKSK